MTTYAEAEADRLRRSRGTDTLASLTKRVEALEAEVADLQRFVRELRYMAAVEAEEVEDLRTGYGDSPLHCHWHTDAA